MEAARTLDAMWLELNERDDRTSPEEYPEMCLINHEEFVGFCEEHAAGRLATLKLERDEADRRAGAAERRNAELLDSASKRGNWFRQAKRAAGYHENVSFDVVWAAALSALLATPIKDAPDA